MGVGSGGRVGRRRIKHKERKYSGALIFRPNSSFLCRVTTTVFTGLRSWEKQNKTKKLEIRLDDGV